MFQTEADNQGISLCKGFCLLVFVL